MGTWCLKRCGFLSWGLHSARKFPTNQFTKGGSHTDLKDSDPSLALSFCFILTRVQLVSHMGVRLDPFPVEQSSN